MTKNTKKEYYAALARLDDKMITRLQARHPLSNWRHKIKHKLRGWLIVGKELFVRVK